MPDEDLPLGYLIPDKVLVQYAWKHTNRKMSDNDLLVWALVNDNTDNSDAKWANSDCSDGMLLVIYLWISRGGPNEWRIPKDVEDRLWGALYNSNQRNMGCRREVCWCSSSMESTILLISMALAIENSTMQSLILKNDLKPSFVDLILVHFPSFYFTKLAYLTALFNLQSLHNHNVKYSTNPRHSYWTTGMRHLHGIKVHVFCLSEVLLLTF